MGSSADVTALRATTTRSRPVRSRSTRTSRTRSETARRRASPMPARRSRPRRRRRRATSGGLRAQPLVDVDASGERQRRDPRAPRPGGPRAPPPPRTAGCSRPGRPSRAGRRAGVRGDRPRRTSTSSPEPVGVLARQRDGLGGEIGREHHGIGSLVLDRRARSRRSPCPRRRRRGPRQSPTAASACSTRISVSGRGMNTPGPHLEREPAERLVAGQVLHRRPGAPLAHRAPEHPGLARVEALPRARTAPRGRCRARASAGSRPSRRGSRHRGDPGSRSRAGRPRRDARVSVPPVALVVAARAGPRARPRAARRRTRPGRRRQHVRQPVDVMLDAVIGHAILGEVVGTDLLGALARCRPAIDGWRPPWPRPPPAPAGAGGRAGTASPSRGSAAASAPPGTRP